MTVPPAVSVIIPTYNSCGTLRLALESVRRQSLRDLEVWVVGDGCTDASETTVAAFGDDRFHWLNLDANSGTPSRPRNEGLARARGRYVAYLGHDDLWFPWHLEGLLRLIRDEHGELAYSLAAAISPTGPAAFFSLPRRLFDLADGYSPSNWLHERSLIETIGPWSTKTLVSSDLEFLRRVFRHQARTAFHPALSALKFPAVYWKMYSLPGDPPQARYLEAMGRDAAALSRGLMAALSGPPSKSSPIPGTKSGFARRTLGFGRAMLRLYGYRLWPLSRLVYGRYRRRAGLPRRVD